MLPIILAGDVKAHLWLEPSKNLLLHQSVRLRRLRRSRGHVKPPSGREAFLLLTLRIGRRMSEKSVSEATRSIFGDLVRGHGDRPNWNLGSKPD